MSQHDQDAAYRQCCQMTRVGHQTHDRWQARLETSGHCTEVQGFLSLLLILLLSVRLHAKRLHHADAPQVFLDHRIGVALAASCVHGHLLSGAQGPPQDKVNDERAHQPKQTERKVDHEKDDQHANHKHHIKQQQWQGRYQHVLDGLDIRGQACYEMTQALLIIESRGELLEMGKECAAQTEDDELPCCCQQTHTHVGRASADQSEEEQRSTEHDKEGEEILGQRLGDDQRPGLMQVLAQ